MITVPVRIMKRRGFMSNELHIVEYRGLIPSPTMKSGKRRFAFCAMDFNDFFDIPEGATDMRMTLAKRSSDPKYYEITKGLTRWGEECYLLDGFEVLGLMSNAANSMKQVWNEGYRYVMFDYKEAA